VSHQIEVMIDGVGIVTDYTLDRLTIESGRRSVTEAPDPATLSLSIVHDSSLAELDLEAFRIGRRVDVNVTILGDTGPGPTYRRFGGVITDLIADRHRLDLTAVAYPLQMLARQEITLSSFDGFANDVLPLVVAQVGDAGDLSAPPFTPAGGFRPRLLSDPGTVELANGDPITNENALQVARRIALSEPFGVLFEDLRTLALRFSGRTTRDVRNTSPAITFTGEEISERWTATRRVSALTNRAVISNDTEDRETFEDTVSTAQIGTFERSLSTYIKSPADLINYGNVLVAHGTDPGWQIDAIAVPLETVDPARKAQILAELTVSTLIEIPELNPNLPTRFFIEGYSEELARNRWNLKIYVSDVQLSFFPDTWGDVPDGLLWQNVDPDLTWGNLARRNVTGFELQRWDELTAQWASVDPGLDWNDLIASPV